MAPNVACTSNCNLYTICLTNANTHCTAFDVNATTQTVISAISLAILIYQVITDRQGKSTDESEGDEGGNETQFHDCLAAAPNSTGGNNQVYMTDNCFGNPNASWECVAVTSTSCNYFSVSALNQGEHLMLTTLNTNNNANIYVEPRRSGTWQQWSWYFYGVCTSGCNAT